MVIKCTNNSYPFVLNTERIDAIKRTEVKGKNGMSYYVQVLFMPT